MKSVPVIVTVAPVVALIGLTLVIVGGAAFATEGAISAPKRTTISNPKRRARGAAPHIGFLIGTAETMRNPQTE